MDEQQCFAKIKRQTGKALGYFRLIEQGDRILIGISGGKDSWALFHALDALHQRSPLNYTLIPVTIDAGFSGFDSQQIVDYLHKHNYHGHVERTQGREIIAAKRRPGSSYCSFCARLRRAALYSVAQRLECNKLALGHHLDDHIETLLLNQFYSGTIAAMSPKLLADNQQITVIRPLVYVEEQLIARWSNLKALPNIGNNCPERAAKDQKRQRIKQLVTTLSTEIPHIRGSLLSAMGHVQPRHLLDKNLKPF